MGWAGKLREENEKGVTPGSAKLVPWEWGWTERSSHIRSAVELGMRLNLEEQRER